MITLAVALPDSHLSSHNYDYVNFRKLLMILTYLPMLPRRSPERQSHRGLRRRDSRAKAP
jgi:hypothetical protein